MSDHNLVIYYTKIVRIIKGTSNNIVYTIRTEALEDVPGIRYNKFIPKIRDIISRTQKVFSIIIKRGVFQ